MDLQASSAPAVSPSDATEPRMWRAPVGMFSSGFADARRRTRVFNLLQVPYQEALDLQHRHHERILSGSAELNALFLLEHPHVYTLGRSFHETNLLIDRDECRSRGIEVIETDRGGDITYHGPGQLIGYPILNLARWKQDVDAYVTALEEVIIRTLADFGITGSRSELGRGVWVGARKIASLGVKVRRWVTLHGFALNVNTDLEYFRPLHPCGMPSSIMTSMVQEGMPVERQDEVRDSIIRNFGQVFEAKMQIENDADLHRTLRPGWLKAPVPDGPRYRQTKKIVDDHRLNTVCESANCPNRGECWSQGTATFMINGNVCTRSCSFCNVFTGKPLELNPHEPEAVAHAVVQMGLDHVVITAVNRDELPDGGAGQFAATIRAIRTQRPQAQIEVLVPDFMGREDAIDLVIAERPEVFNHNMETVPRLYKQVRPQARYQRSLDVLARAAAAGLVAKSGIMVGLGEENHEVLEVMRDMRTAGVNILTIGQYLRPSDRHHPIIRYVTPEEFDAWREAGLAMGFSEVASGPLVRSSYHAKQSFQAAMHRHG